MQPLSSRKYRPAPEPTALRVVAFSGFVIAGTSLLFHGFGSTLDNTHADRRVQKALEGVENPSTQAMARSLARSIEVRDGLRDHLARRLPTSRWHGQADQAVEFLTSALLAAGGIAILQRRPVAVPVLLAYASLSVGQKLFNAAYLGLFEIPISRSYLESLIRLYPRRRRPHPRRPRPAHDGTAVPTPLRRLPRLRRRDDAAARDTRTAPAGRAAAGRTRTTRRRAGPGERRGRAGTGERVVVVRQPVVLSAPA